MSERLCVVCLKPFQPDSLFNKPAFRMEGDITEAPTPHGILTGAKRVEVPLNVGLCPEHEEYFKEGFVAVVEIWTMRNQEELNKVITEKNGRTGNMIYLPKEVAVELMDYPANNPVIFCERDPFERIKEASKDRWS